MFYIEAQQTLAANEEIRDGQVVVINSPASPESATAKKLGKTLNTNQDKNSPLNGKKGANIHASSSGSPQKQSADNSPKNPPNLNSPKGKGKEKANPPAPFPAPKITTVKADITCNDLDAETSSTPEVKKKKTRRGPRKSKKKNANANTSSNGEGDGAESDDGEEA